MDLWVLAVDPPCVEDPREAPCRTPGYSAGKYGSLTSPLVKARLVR